jgi:HEAT repeat protein
MRYEPALPVLKSLAEKSRSAKVRAYAVAAMGLMGTTQSEAAAWQTPAPELSDRVARFAALGLLTQFDAGSRESIWQAMKTQESAVAAVGCWALQQHPAPDNVGAYAELLKTTNSAWVAAEGIVALGGYAQSAPELIGILLAENPSAPRSAAVNRAAQNARTNPQAARGQARPAPGAANANPNTPAPVDPTSWIQAWRLMMDLYRLRGSSGLVDTVGRRTGIGGGSGMGPVGPNTQIPQAGMAGVQNYGGNRYDQYLKAIEEYDVYSPNQPPGGRRAGVKVVSALGQELVLLGTMRASAAIALGRIGTPEARAALLQALPDFRDEYMLNAQGFAVMSLANFPDAAVRDRLIALLGKKDNRGRMVMDPPKDSPVRGFAAIALGLYARPSETPQGAADPPGLEAVLQALADRLEDANQEETEVRCACAMALGLTQRTAVLPVLARATARLQAATRKDDELILGYVLLARALAGDQNIVDPARRFLLDRRDDAGTSGIMARRAAVLSLGITHTEAVIPTLIKAWELSYYVNRESIVAMRLVGATHTGRMLVDQLPKLRNPQEQAFVAQAIGELLAPEHPTPLARLTAEGNFTIRNDPLIPVQKMSNEFLFGYFIPLFGGDWQ